MRFLSLIVLSFHVLQSCPCLPLHLQRSCRYRPHEVNASDDRSAEALKDTLTRAMHGNTVAFVPTNTAGPTRYDHALMGANEKI